MSYDSVRDHLLEALERVAQDHDIDVVDVEVTGSAEKPTVRVRVDLPEGSDDPISLDEVAAQNAWVSDTIDLVDPFPGSYVLEVSSPGLARPLRRPHDFERYSGEVVSLTTTATEGRKHYSGTLKGFSDGSVALEVDGQPVLIPLDEVKRCKIKPTIDFTTPSASHDAH
jgi:ribosome maturation factor RimP